MRSRYSVTLFTILLATLSVVVVWQANTSQAQSGGAGTVGAGTVGSAVYDGVAVVTTGGNSDGLLEIGHVSTDAANGLITGLDIASTGTINLRPSSLLAANSVQLIRNGTSGRTDLLLPGGICFGTGTPTCYTTWPSGGSSSLWTVVSNQYIQPTTLTNSILINRPSYPGSVTGLEAVSDVSGDAALSVNTSGTLAAQFSGGAKINGDIEVNGSGSDQVQLLTSGTLYNVWHPSNDGHNSGLDVSKLDGIQISTQYTTKLRFCGAFTFPTTGVKCIDLQ